MKTLNEVRRSLIRGNRRVCKRILVIIVKGMTLERLRADHRRCNSREQSYFLYLRKTDVTVCSIMRNNIRPTLNLLQYIIIE